MAKTKETDYIDLFSMGCLWSLFLVFLGLKLAGKLAWSWWWVFAPLWMPLAVLGVLVLITVIILAVEGSVRKKK